MSKKNMESTRELMGTREVTDYSIRTYKNEELVYFFNPAQQHFRAVGGESVSQNLWTDDGA